jgi:hypothetical protein
MAVFICHSESDFGQGSALSLQDFFEEIESEKIMKLGDSDRCLMIAQLLARVEGEKKYITDVLHDRCFNGQLGDVVDGYGDTSVVLGGTDNYSFRIVKWLPGEQVPVPDLERAGLAYELVHNHDFNLITKGIHGDGYETEIYRFDATKYVGAYDEPVDLVSQGKFKLKANSVIWYEKGFDVHVQYPPQTFSISFNVIPRSRSKGYGQFIFDRKSNKIAEFARNGAMRTLAAMTLLCDFGVDEDTKLLITETARTTDSEWLRAALCCLVSDRWGISKDDLFEDFHVIESFRYMSDMDNGRFSVDRVR